jgi:hypothetical protein
MLFAYGSCAIIASPIAKLLKYYYQRVSQAPITKATGGERIAMIRYGFNIKTRSGQRVGNICIMASCREDAERRLRQMYHHCEIIACHSEAVRRGDALDLEAVIGMISNDQLTVPAVARSMLRNKPSAH